MPASETPSQTPPAKPRRRTTSAQRLLTLLATLKKTSGVNAYRVLPTVLSLNSTTDEIELGWAFSEGIILISKMLDDLALEISISGLSEDEQAYHNGCRSLVIGAMCPVRMNYPWDQVKAGISDTLMSRLESADVALRRSVTEIMLAQLDLRDLRESVEAALESIRESSLPQELKGFIATHLGRVTTALVEYEFRGLTGLQDALAGYVGTLAVAKDAIVEHTTEPQKRKLSDVLIIANGVMTLAHNVAIAFPKLHAGFQVIAGLLGA